jgi:hypothetical protein
VVVLSSHSIFVDGVAARLKKQLDDESLAIIEMAQEDALAQVVALQPAVVILDAVDAAVNHLCSIGSLLTSLPVLTLIRLDPEQNQIQVVTSEQRSLTQLQELVQVITER